MNLPTAAGTTNFQSLELPKPVRSPAFRRNERGEEYAMKLPTAAGATIFQSLKLFIPRIFNLPVADSPKLADEPSGTDYQPDGDSLAGHAVPEERLMFVVAASSSGRVAPKHEPAARSTRLYAQPRERSHLPDSKDWKTGRAELPMIGNRAKTQPDALPPTVRPAPFRWAGGNSGRSLVLAAIALILSGSSATAELQLSQLFCDHMVMQRNMKVPVWGWAEPGEEITVAIDGQTKTVQADPSGKWMVRLDAMDTGKPRRMTVKGKSGAVEVNDILLGEVWLCSGQSNMAWPLKQAMDGAREVAAADYPEIRLFDVPYAMDPKVPLERLRNDNPVVRSNYCNWRPCSPGTARDFSAVAYFFGRDLHQALRVPVGLIHNAVGGSPIVAWTSRSALMADPDFHVVARYFDGLANYVENTPEGKEDLAARSAEYEAKQAEARAGGKPALWPPKYPGPLQSSSFGSCLYNALVNPLIPYGIRGVVWYQGEAEWEWMYEYRGIFPVMIRDWRNRWGEGDFPFLFVQLPNWAEAKAEPDSGGWAMIRESQLRTLRVTNTAMAVTIDVGEAANIHPADKQDVGARLAVAARGAFYGGKLAYSGPIYRAMKIEGASIRLFFDHAGSGLMVGRKEPLVATVEVPAGKLRRFAIAGEDHHWVWGEARIEKDTVVVSSPSVPKPVAVRYAWANNPEGCNLYNKEGLPASPFRTDETRAGPAPAMGSFYKSRLQKGFSLAPVK